MVHHVTDNGFLHLARVGGSDRAIARGQRVRILGDEGEVLGVVGNTAIHLRDRSGGEKIPEVHELFVDIGADSDEDVAERGVRVGHPMVFDVAPTMLTDSRITARAIDNRLGGFIIAQAIERLAADRPQWTTLAANSVQEEIGGHGAQMITHRLNPDVALAFDVTHATDSPGIDPKQHGDVKMGEGPRRHARHVHPPGGGAAPDRGGRRRGDSAAARTKCPTHRHRHRLDLQDAERCVQCTPFSADSLHALDCRGDRHGDIEQCIAPLRRLLPLADHRRRVHDDAVTCSRRRCDKASQAIDGGEIDGGEDARRRG